jgi:hypothetical protein
VARQIDKVTNRDGKEVFKLYALDAEACNAAVQRQSLRELPFGTRRSVQFLGYSMPSTTTAGDTLTVAVYWRLVSEPSDLPSEYSLFAHVVDNNGRAWAGKDHWGFGELERGECVLSWFDIGVNELVPLGLYWVEFGMYDRDTMNRLPFFTVDGQPASQLLRLGPVKVAPQEGFSLPVPQITHMVTLGEDIRLLGYSLNSDLEPGKALEVELVWQAAGDPHDDYTVFVHVIGPTGELIAQHDDQPRQGAYPTSHWAKGEVISDGHVLNLPSTLSRGPYVLRVGMYQPATMQRLPAYQEGKRLPGDTVVLADIPNFGP